MLIRTLIAALLLMLTSTARAELRFHVEPEDEAGRLARVIMRGGQVTIYASGQIDAGDANRLRQFVRTRGIESGLITFDSPGGSLAEALLLGDAIRDLGFDTGVGRLGMNGSAAEGLCASACAYAFAGGVNRHFTSYDGRLGIHQFYLQGQTQADVADVQITSAVIIEYLRRMGVESSAFSAAAITGSEQMLWLSPADAEALNLANNGVQPTTAEIRTVDMVPYLRLEQVRQTHHSRVLILCGERGPVMMAGVVSTPQDVEMQAELSIRSYIELDGSEELVEQGNEGLVPEDSVLWMMRGLDPSFSSRLLRANRLDFWGEGGGAVRWGGMMDLRPVRRQLETFLNDCRNSRL